MAQLPEEYIEQVTKETVDKVFDTVRRNALWAAENVPEGVTAREALIAFANTLRRAEP